MSGYAAVVFDARDRSAEPVSIGSWFKCSGNNFLAEMCAIVAAVLAVPAQADVCIYTDSQSCIDAVARDDSAEKRRLRAAARPMVTTLRRLIRSRPGAVAFTHVRSHSGKADFLSRGNDLADARANRERERAAVSGDRGQNFLFNEERVIAYVQWPGRTWEEHVIGDVGRACREWMRREMFQSWASLPHQGRVAKVAGIAEVRELCKAVRRSMDSAALLDLTLALCERMAVGVRWEGGQAPRCSEHGRATCGLALAVRLRGTRRPSIGFCEAPARPVVGL